MDANTANGPEDEALDWDQVDWGQVEDDVRRLRQRIFTASKAGDLKRVHNLQKLMIRSRANALLSVRRVSEVNAGRKTAGVDGKTALMASQKAALADWVQQRAGSWRPKPVKRVYVPKKNGRPRPLGIPVIRDRAYWLLATMHALMHGAASEIAAGRLEPGEAGPMLRATLLGAYAPPRGA